MKSICWMVALCLGCNPAGLPSRQTHESLPFYWRFKNLGIPVCCTNVCRFGQSPVHFCIYLQEPNLYNEQEANRRANACVDALPFANRHQATAPFTLLLTLEFAVKDQSFMVTVPDILDSQSAEKCALEVQSLLKSKTAGTITLDLRQTSAIGITGAGLLYAVSCTCKQHTCELKLRINPQLSCFIGALPLGAQIEELSPQELV